VFNIVLDSLTQKLGELVQSRGDKTSFTTPFGLAFEISRLFSRGGARARTRVSLESINRHVHLTYRHFIKIQIYISMMSENEPYTARDEIQRKCSTCNIVFQRTTHLRRHMLTHTQDKRFVCSQCGKSFVRRFAFPSLLGGSKTVQ
jgi:hypothetical protein